jgi:hypothetical protein
MRVAGSDGVIILYCTCSSYPDDSSSSYLVRPTSLEVVLVEGLEIGYFIGPIAQWCSSGSHIGDLFAKAK